MSSDNYLTLGAIAKDIGRTRRTVERWVQSGKLKAVKLYGRFLVSQNDYEEWKQRNIIDYKGAG